MEIAGIALILEKMSNACFIASEGVPCIWRHALREESLQEHLEDPL